METYVTCSKSTKKTDLVSFFFAFLALLDTFCNFLTPPNLPLDISYHLVKTELKNITPFKSYGNITIIIVVKIHYYSADWSRHSLFAPWHP